MKLYNRQIDTTRQNEICSLPHGGDAVKNTELIRQRLGDSSDLSIRSLQLGGNALHPECLVQLIFLDGMVDSQLLQEVIIPALQNTGLGSDECNLLENFSNNILSAGQVKETGDLTNAIKEILSGYLLLLIDGYDRGLLLAMQGYEKRSIGETKTETVIRGPQEAFVEDLHINITMIRRKMKDERLRVVTRSAGQLSKTDISVLFMEGLADESILDRIADILDRFALKTVLEGEYIEEYLQSRKTGQRYCSTC